MKKGIVLKVISIMEFILLLLLCLWLKIDWLLIISTILMAICVVLSFVLNDKQNNNSKVRR